MRFLRLIQSGIAHTAPACQMICFETQWLRHLRTCRSVNRIVIFAGQRYRELYAAKVQVPLQTNKLRQTFWMAARGLMNGIQDFVKEAAVPIRTEKIVAEGQELDGARALRFQEEE
jgi:hypothetical protein